MKKILLAFALPLALLFSCSSDGGEQTEEPSDFGSIVLSPRIVFDAENMVTRATSTNWKTYTVIVTDSETVEVFNGVYPANGIIPDLAVGTYTVRLTSHPAGFAVPAFDTQVYEGSETATVTKGVNTPVEITCYQANAGVYFIYDPSLAAAGFDDVIPTVTQDEGALEYIGDDNKNATGYFLPKPALLAVKNGSSPINIGGDQQKELDLQAKQLWKITLKAVVSDGDITVVADIDVTVIDKEEEFELEFPVPVWDKPTGERLNLRGKVRSVSEHVLVQRDNQATDLEFNENGWVTSLTHTKSNLTEVPATITYDGNNRITKIEAQDPSGAFSVEFTYGTHGKYVTTDEIINGIVSTYKMLPYYLIMPAMMKDVESVRVLEEGEPIWELAFNFGEGHNTADLIDSYGTEPDYYTYTFDGDYTKTVSYEFWGTVTTIYTVDPETGCILSSISDDGVAYYFLNDRINSFVKVESEWTGNVEYELNSNLDLIRITDEYSGITEFDYDYDEKGNWYNMFNETQLTYIDRAITYR